MDRIISFTPAQFVTAILAICAGVSCIAGGLAVIIKAFKRAKAPEERQDERITKLEERMAKHDELFANDNDRLEVIEEGNRITQRAILALLSHGIDGNDVEGMKASKKELERYLIDR